MTKTTALLLCVVCALCSLATGFGAGGLTSDRIKVKQCDKTGYFITKDKSYKCTENK